MKLSTTRQHIAWLIGAEVLALLLVAGVTAVAYPVNQAARMTMALAVAYAVPRWLYGRSDHATLAGHGVLLVAALWLATIAITFVRHATLASGASFTMPYLYNDASNYYNWALAHYDGSAVEPKVTFWGYSILIVAMWKVLGVNIIWPVAANVMITLLTIVLTGKLASRLIGERHARVATLAMAMLTVMGFFMSQGSQMLKESWAYLAITLIACGMVPCGLPKRQLRNQREKGGNGASSVVQYALIYALGCLLLAAIRAKYVNFLFFGIVMMAVAGRLRQWRYYVMLLAVTLACWFLGMAMTDHYTVVQQVNNVTGEGGMATIFTPEGPYQRILGDYFHYPVWKKLLYLPVTCGVQWIIPFPWLPEGHSLSWLSIAPRLRLGWYVLSGVVLYFYLFRSYRRGWQWAVWAWFPMVCYVGIAYMTAGTVSRYILAFQPWWMALAAITLLTCWRLRSFRVFMMVYLAAMAALLTACYLMV